MPIEKSLHQNPSADWPSTSSTIVVDIYERLGLRTGGKRSEAGSLRRERSESLKPVNHFIDALSCNRPGKEQQPWRPRPRQLLWLVGFLSATLLSPASAQDVRGMEVCTAEKKMERRTSCLQANVEFLQQVLYKLSRDTQDRIAATDRDLTAAHADIAALKSAIEKLNSELAQVKAKAEAPAKK